MFEGMFEIFNEEEKEKQAQETEITYPSDSAGGPGIIVVSLGGSVIVQEKPDPGAISAIAQCLNELIRSGQKLVLVVGGGRTARNYVNAAKGLGANNFELDELGIMATRMNASLLINSIDNAFPEVLTEVKKSSEILDMGKTPVFGGIMPGFTTDAVAALIAEYLGARFINLSNVDGIYTADPSVFPNARMYCELSYGKLLEILTQNAMKPSQNLILDLPAAMILRRSGLTAFFLSGHDMENFKAAVQGMPFKGTVVSKDSQDSFGGEETPARKRPVRKKAQKRPARKRPKGNANFLDEEDQDIDPSQIRF